MVSKNRDFWNNMTVKHLLKNLMAAREKYGDDLEIMLKVKDESSIGTIHLPINSWDLKLEKLKDDITVVIIDIS